MTRLAHHVRLSLAVGLEFQRDDHLQSVSFVIANWIVNLSDLLAAWLSALLLFSLPGTDAPRRVSPRLVRRVSSYLAAERRAWAIEWPLICEATRLALAGRWVWLEA